jgi:hypothetical protein
MVTHFPTVTSNEFPLVGEGLYLVELQEVKEPVEKTDGPFGPSVRTCLVWKIVSVLDGETENEQFVGSEVYDFANWTLGEKSTLRQRVEAALNRPLEIGETLKTDELLGAKVKMTIGHNTRQKDGVKVHKVVTTAPYRGNGNRQKKLDDDQS